MRPGFDSRRSGFFFFFFSIHRLDWQTDSRYFSHTKEELNESDRNRRLASFSYFARWSTHSLHISSLFLALSIQDLSDLVQMREQVMETREPLVGLAISYPFCSFPHALFLLWVPAAKYSPPAHLLLHCCGRLSFKWDCQCCDSDVAGKNLPGVAVGVFSRHLCEKLIIRKETCMCAVA